MISVIIPAFNEERYLPATLQAVAKSAQAMNAEVIVVDNNSTDSTANIARAHGARVVTEPIHNIARVRNTGAAAAQGDILVFLDADTIIPAELLPRIRHLFATSACTGGAVDIEYRPKKRIIRLYLAAWRMLGRIANLAQGATQFCYRDTFTVLHGYNESLYMGEDVDFYARLRKHGPVTFIRDLKVIPSCRRFDQWPLWRTLLFTNPFVIAPLRRVRNIWRGWYDSPLR